MGCILLDPLIINPCCVRPDSSSPEKSQIAPRDKKEFITVMSKLNRLAGPEVHPWHLIVTFRMLDPTGDNAEVGAYEEFWAARLV
jgi:hypothetical protein